MRPLLAASLLLMLAGCGAPVLDASTEESYKASLAKVNADLEPGKQAALKKALEVMAFKGITGALSEPGRGIDDFRASVDGKTADEIIEMATANP